MFLAAFYVVTRIDDIVADPDHSYLVGGNWRSRGGELHQIKLFEIILGSILCCNRIEGI